MFFLGNLPVVMMIRTASRCGGNTKEKMCFFSSFSPSRFLISFFFLLQCYQECISVTDWDVEKHTPQSMEGSLVVVRLCLPFPELKGSSTSSQSANRTFASKLCISPKGQNFDTSFSVRKEQSKIENCIGFPYFNLKSNFLIFLG